MATCAGCETELPPKRPGMPRRWCSEPCRIRTRDAARPKSSDWAEGRQPERVLVCRDCGREHVTRSPNGLCAECRPLATAERNARKRNARRGAPRTGTYTLRMIGDRDDWSCHVCGESVDPSLSGLDPLGPTRDHVVAISRGGVDGPENVRLAHRVCNVRRGAAA